MLQLFEILEIEQCSTINQTVKRRVKTYGAKKTESTSRDIEHFQIAPVAAASKGLLSFLSRRSCNGRRPIFFRTRSRISLSSAHYYEKKNTYRFLYPKNFETLQSNLEYRTCTMFFQFIIGTHEILHQIRYHSSNSCSINRLNKHFNSYS